MSRPRTVRGGKWPSGARTPGGCAHSAPSVGTRQREIAHRRDLVQAAGMTRTAILASIVLASIGSAAMAQPDYLDQIKRTCDREWGHRCWLCLIAGGMRSAADDERAECSALARC